MFHAHEIPKHRVFAGRSTATRRADWSIAIASLAAFGLIGAVTLSRVYAMPASPEPQGVASAMAALGGALAAATVVAWRRAIQRLDRRAPSDRSLGPYTLQEKLGEGGMGVVYKARHALLERPAAIKVLPPDRANDEAVVRFEREVQRTSMLSHPNTIGIYDFGRTEDGSFYYAMEYIDGLDLESLVERHGPQDPGRVAHLLGQLTAALSEAHAAGLVHRDVKPANIMVCDRGGARDVVKVLDFGLSQSLAERGCPAQSEIQTIVGTPLYLSPEALTAPETMDARSDLYAVGAVGYFLLTGTTPFTGRNLLEICGHHLHSVPEAPSRRLGAPVPRKLEKLILSCLSKSPELRPRSAEELRQALLDFAATWQQGSTLERLPAIAA